MLHWSLQQLLRLLVRPQIVGRAQLRPANSTRYYLLEHARSEHRLLLTRLLQQQGISLHPEQLLYANSGGLAPLREHLLPLIRRQQQSPEQPIEIVPVVIYHGRLPSKPPRGFKWFYRESWQPPDRLSRLLQLLVHGRDTLIQFDQPLRLPDLAPLDDTTGCARKAARILKTHFQLRRKAAIGPDLSHRRTLIELVIRHPEVQAELDRQQRESGQSRLSLEQQSRQTLMQIAANFNPHTARALGWLLDWLWPRLYSRIHVCGIEPVQQRALNHQLVYLPCHRSHLDYVLLSWALHRHGLMLPHIAAGENLNLPIIGRILKQGGAIFMRRRFQGDRLYYALYKAYLAQMSHRGHALEYFIEGGRSRTGRLLPPKTGLLSMTLDSYRSDPGQPVALVPVWIGYDRLPESSSYSRELAGEGKTPESLRSALGALKRLRQRYGEVVLSFGEPLPLAELPAEQSLSEVTGQVAQQVMCRINSAALPTRSALLATVLLGWSGEPLDSSRTGELLRQLNQLLERGGIPVPTGLPSAWLMEFWQIGLIGLRHNRIELQQSQRLELGFYRNQLLHQLILPGLWLLLAQRLGPLPSQTVNRIIHRLYPYLQAELFLPDSSELTAQLRRWRDSLAAQGLIEQRDKRWQCLETPLAALLCRTVEPVLARYYLMLRLLARYRTIDRQELIEESRQRALELHRLFGFRSPEYGARELYSGFIDSLIQQRIIRADDQQLACQRDPTAMLRQAEKVLLPQLKAELDRQLNEKQG
ncbi:1-acyl-sn-glycerol-3-phosphate acyltransferase [Marinobacterium arenosum]|uniref:1-acyl-sn-glycerol-3-phosphate acyltransferase n=1 Tax=Marinobacterium arenosum TaxID=2862496 RepID=UPI001C95A734|nr:1-acyl-sn-glycerol-3-phosphate acyltransferase [Marinobacterium arenosum]MBY4679003.1 1-acyl-sn-glycerol-3-phosphate acyltransferase [Marinobacterium arenosum]